MNQLLLNSGLISNKETDEMNKAKRDMFNSIGLLLFCCFAFYGSTQIPIREMGNTEADFFPIIVIGVISFLSICLLISSIYKMIKNKDSKTKTSIKEMFQENKKIIWTFFIFASYVFLLKIIGYFLSSVIFLILLYILLAPNRRKLWLVSLGAAAITFVLFVIFQNGLSVFLPTGSLF